MIRSLYNGVAGVKTNNFGYDVMANNISNVNTPGFIGSQWEFETMISQGLTQTAANPTTSQVGLGSTKMASSLTTWRQGSFQSTDGKFDMAIAGKGFFGVANSENDVYYTRAGSFIRDSNGDLVDPNGLYLLGTSKALSPIALSPSAEAELRTFDGVPKAYTIDVDEELKLTTADAQTKINLPDVLFLPAKATTEVKFKGTLSANVETASTAVDLESDKISSIVDIEKKIIDISGNLNDDSGIYSYKAGDPVSVTITDADGVKITKTVNVKADGSYSLENLDISTLNLDSKLSVTGTATVVQEIASTANFTTELQSATGYTNILTLNFTKQIPSGGETTTWDVTANLTSPTGELISTSDGFVRFNSNGALIANTLGTINNEGTAVTINLGTIIGGGYDGISLGDESAITSVERNGEAEGILRDYVLQDDGNIYAVFDNSVSTKIAKVALYHFQNEQGLSAISSTLFQKSANSGNPEFWLDKDGEVIYGAQVKANYLEMPNVNLANELTDMITLSKAYTASSKSITTSDEILQTIIGLKR